MHHMAVLVSGGGHTEMPTCCTSLSPWTVRFPMECLPAAKVPLSWPTELFLFHFQVTKIQYSDAAGLLAECAARTGNRDVSCSGTGDG